MHPPTPVPVALREAPAWVSAYSSNAAAWRNGGSPSALLAWLEESLAPATEADLRRRVGRIVRAVLPTPRPLGVKALDAIAKRHADFVDRWLSGGDFDEAAYRAELVTAEEFFDDIPPSARHLWKTPTDQGLQVPGMNVSDHLAKVLAPCAAARVPLRAVVGEVQTRLPMLRIDPEAWRAALLAELPDAPAGFSEPTPPVRWNR